MVPCTVMAMTTVAGTVFLGCGLFWTLENCERNTTSVVWDRIITLWWSMVLTWKITLQPPLSFEHSFICSPDLCSRVWIAHQRMTLKDLIEKGRKSIWQTIWSRFFQKATKTDSKPFLLTQVQIVGYTANHCNTKHSDLQKLPALTLMSSSVTLIPDTVSLNPIKMLLKMLE